MRAQTPILNRDERERLHAIVRRATSTRRDIFRAQIILGAADGLSNQAIAAQHKTRPATVSKWRSRFPAQRQAGPLRCRRRAADSAATGGPTSPRLCPLERRFAGRGAARHFRRPDLAGVAQTWDQPATTPQLVCE